MNNVELGRSAFSAWQAAGGDVHGKYANPLFVSLDSSSTDFLKLSANSPARSAGAMTGDAAPVFCDFDGNPRAIGQITDVGARLYGTLAAVAQSGKVRPVSGHTVHSRYTMSTNQIYDLRGRIVNVIHAGGKSRAAVVTLRKDGTEMVRGVKVAP